MDRISSLPEELLCHISSFLTTKEAALTSILSKRWRTLFAFVSNLDIDDSVFLYPQEGKRERERIMQSFVDFVDRVLALRGDSPIVKLSLKCKCTTGDASEHINRWICNVLQRGVSDLDLSIHFGFVYHPPSEIFMSRTLVKLKIGRGTLISSWATNPFLPMLKTLVLESVWFSNGKFQILLSACPALEELDIEGPNWLSSETMTSASLKTLTIKSANLLHAFSFDTPNLVCLKYSGLIPKDYLLFNLENLVDAQIELRLTDDQITQTRAQNTDGLEHDALLRLSNVQKLVRSIQHVQKLDLSSGALELLSLSYQTMPMFNNLTFLSITSDTDLGWQAMPVLFKNCPHLETLVIKGLLHHVTDKCGDACICISREEKGRSLMSCPLKRLEIREFRGTWSEMEMIRHFLDYFPRLEEMKIYEVENSPTQLQDPLVLEAFLKLLRHYNNVSSCNVEFKAEDSSYRK